MGTLLITKARKQHLITGVNSFGKLGLKACTEFGHMEILRKMFPSVYFVNFSMESVSTNDMLKKVRIGQECAGAILTDVHLKWELFRGKMCDLHLVGQTFTIGYYAVPFLHSAQD